MRLPQPFADIAARLPGWRPSVLFDVGANIGQSAGAYATLFPDAVIHAFEPVPESFAALRRNLAGRPQLRLHNLALGSEAGTLRMTANGTATGNHVVTAANREDVPEVEVPAETGAGFAARFGIAAISFLKIDTEGHDQAVLRGFLPLLPRIDFVMVEAAMNPYNRTHAPFRPMEDLLRDQGFLLFRFYEQAFEFKRGGRPVLRRANPLFVNGALVDVTGIR